MVLLGGLVSLLAGLPVHYGLVKLFDMSFMVAYAVLGGFGVSGVGRCSCDGLGAYLYEI